MTNNPYKKVAYIASFGTVILDDPDPSFDPYDGYDESDDTEIKARTVPLRAKA